MAFNHGRFLLPEPKLDDKKHEDDDNGKKNDSDCHFIHCNQQHSSPSPPSPPHNFPPYLILTVCSIAVAVVLLLFLAYCAVRRCRSRRTPTSPPPSDGILIDDDEEEELRQQQGHVGVVDHHVWHIRTIGLSEVAIDSIAAFKYKKRDGLIEGTTDCSVCLNEFLEDERLRLLPKCSHAFHVACIDTWLRCHTNCPVCRAPVVAGDGNGGPEGSLAGTGSSSAGPREENRAESEIRTGETEGFNVSIVCNRSTRNEKFRVVSDLGDRVNVDQDQKSRGQVRRAVSMDFSRF